MSQYGANGMAKENYNYKEILNYYYQNIEITEEDFVEGKIDVLTMLVKSGLVPSKSEARRAVEQGGVTADGEKVTDTRVAFDEATLKNGVVLRRGKKNYKKKN